MEMKKVISVAIAFAMLAFSFAIAQTASAQITSDSDNSTTITVNAAYPKLWWIGFNSSVGPGYADLTQTQQTVANVVPYAISLGYNYSLGYTNVDIIINGWYDFGVPNAVQPALADPTRNMAFQIEVDPATWGVTMNFPGAPEMGCAATAFVNDLDDHGGGIQDTQEVFIPIWFGYQVRAAEYDGAGIGPTFSQTKNLALDNAFTWDFSVRVQDNVQVTAQQTAWAEFGIQRNVAVTVSGNPTANAPPGTVGMLMAPNSHIVYSANTPYFVNVSLDRELDLNGIAANPEITTDNVHVQNVHPDAAQGVNTAIGVPYTIVAPLTNLYVWGWNNTPLPTDDFPMLAPSHGNVSAGPADSDYTNLPGWTELQWVIDVPGATAEGVYWAHIIVSIDS